MLLIKKVLFVALFLLLITGFLDVHAVDIDFSRNEFSKCFELIVDDEGDGDYRSIQKAIDNVDSGGIISVFSGVYHECVKISKPLSIRGVACELGDGDDSGVPIIDGGGRKDVVVVDSECCVFSGFKVVDSGLKYSAGCGIKILCDDCKISGNIVKNCFVGIDAGDVSCCQISENVLYYNVFGINLGRTIDCRIYNNSLYNSGLTIVSDVEDVVKNIFSNNTVNGRPLFLFLRVNDTVISDVDVGQLILVDCHNITLEKLEISNTTIGVEIAESSNITVRNCVFSDIHRGGISFHGENFEVYNVSFKNCSYGCYLEAGSNGFYIHHNNFIDVYKHDQAVISWVKKHQTFVESKNIVFDSNYYSDWIGLKVKILGFLPKFIPGYPNYFCKTLNICPVFKFDFNPSLKPYNITL
ncbi:MAG: right-handed parallel beta-helix repeat-containing protein [Candidatus Thermoplasmatota archaeon]